MSEEKRKTKTKLCENSKNYMVERSVGAQLPMMTCSCSALSSTAAFVLLHHVVQRKEVADVEKMVSRYSLL